MGLREDFQKRIEKKQQEIAELQLKLREAAAYIQALQDTIRLLPKDANSAAKPEQTLRPGSGVARARDAIKKAGKPMHISEILKALNLPVDKQHRISLSGSLAGYARREEIFNRPAPNTFGLMEFGSKVSGQQEPPDDFGGASLAELEELNTEEISDDDIPFP